MCPQAWPAQPSADLRGQKSISSNKGSLDPDPQPLPHTPAVWMLQCSQPRPGLQTQLRVFASDFWFLLEQRELLLAELVSLKSVSCFTGAQQFLTLRASSLPSPRVVHVGRWVHADCAA